MDNAVFPGGMTVAELKAILADWPERDANGDPTRVWLTTGPGLSAVAASACPLNAREDGGARWADLLLSPAEE